MSTMPRRQYGIFVTIGLAVIAAVVAGVVLFTSSSASNVNLTTARYVPADAGFYVAFNTDLDSSQWIAAFDLAERLGQEDPEAELEDAADDADIEWEDEVAPFLGGNAAVYVRTVDIASGPGSFAAIIRANDAGKALDVMLEKAGEFEAAEEDGHEYHFDPFGGLYVARLDDHLVVASDEESLFEVFAVADGDIDSLNEDEKYSQLRDNVTGNFLAFLYVNLDVFADDILGDADTESRDALEAAGLEGLTFEPMAYVIGAKDDAFEFQAASVAEAGVTSPMMEAKESRFVKMVPADASFFAVTRNIAQTWDQTVENARAEIDEAIRAEGEYDNLDEALEAAGREVGLNSIEELIDLFTGEAAIAGWFPTGDEDEPEFVYLAEVEDEAAARDVIEAMSTSGDGEVIGTENVAGVEVTTFVSDDDEIAWAVTDGFLLLGTPGGVRATLEGGDHLDGVESYQRAVDQVPSKLGSYAYFDLFEIMRLEEAGVPPVLDEATQALDAVIINIVEDKGIVRVNGALTVAE